MTEVNGSKRCGRCKEVKALEEFGRVKGKPRSYCRPCHKSSVNTPDPRKEKRCACCGETKPVTEFNRLGKRYQPYCRSCNRVVVHERHIRRQMSGEATEDHRAYYWKKRKWVRLKNKYGCDQATYEALEKEQGGVCAICRQPETDQYKGTTLELAVDHDHKTGKIRGLLCRSCNLAIGKFKEDVRIVEAALEYLRKHSN